MSNIRGFHVDFTWVSYAEGEVEACDWLGGERCVTGREKSAGSLWSCFGRFGVIFGPDECPMGSFEKGDIKLSFPSVKPVDFQQKIRELERHNGDPRNSYLRAVFGITLSHGVGKQ